MAKELGCNPWLAIWTRPRSTIRSIVDYNLKYRLGWLYWIYGLPVAFNMAQSLSLGQYFPSYAIAIGALILAWALGFVGVAVVTALLYWTGKWIGGIGTFAKIRASVAWSSALNIPTILTWGVLFAFFGGQVFFSSFPETPFIGTELMAVFGVFLLQTVVSIWSFVVLLHALGEVQGFSAWKGLLNVVIPLVMIIVTVWLLMLLLATFRVSQTV